MQTHNRPSWPGLPPSWSGSAPLPQAPQFAQPQCPGDWGLYVAQTLQHLVDKAAWQQEVISQMSRSIEEQRGQINKLKAAMARPDWVGILRGQVWKIALAVIIVIGSKAATGKWPNPGEILKLFAGLI